MIEVKKKLPIKIEEEYVIIDIETTGLEPGVDYVVALGLIKDNLIVQYFRERNDFDFDKKVREIVEEITKNRKIVCYTGFVKKFLNISDEKYIDIFEEFKKRAEFFYKKWPKLNELITFGNLLFEVHDRVDGSDIPEIYFKYLECKNEIKKQYYIYKILQHNYVDLIRSLTLFLILY